MTFRPGPDVGSIAAKPGRHTVAIAAMLLRSTNGEVALRNAAAGRGA
jgi:hypothetical protein